MPPTTEFSALSDSALVTLALQGREEGFREIVYRYTERVQALIYRIVRQHDLAEDLTQETFIAAYEALATHRPDSKFSSWLLKIANNAALKHVRRKELDTQPLGDAPNLTPAKRARPTGFEVADRISSTSGRRLALFRQNFEIALTKLKPKQRRCFQLRHVENRDYDEIAEILQISEENARVITLRARTKLQEILRFLAENSPSDPAMTPI